MTDIVIHAGQRDGKWTVRAYDEETNEHLWSSEEASSLQQAMREVAEGIEKVTRARN